MKKILGILLSVSIFISFISCDTKCDCENQQTVEKEYVTKKILYDVNIVNERISPDRYNDDWFWENIPVNDLELFLTKVYDDVKSGKIKAYVHDAFDDYEEFEEIKKENLEEYFANTVVLYETYAIEDNGMIIDETVKTAVKKSDIKMLRFLEEWYFSNGEFKKEVIAVAPVFVKHNGGGLNINPGYWVFVKDLN